MEVSKPNDQQSGIFKQSEKFEIDEKEFREIQIDNNRVIAKGKSWETFEVLISFIGAAWMEKWRRFGVALLAAGVFLLGLPFFAFLIPGMGLFFYSGSGMFLMLLFMVVGIVLIIVWGVVKREALKIYTPGGSFKIEGSAGFVDAVWKAITEAQRSRDV